MAGLVCWHCGASLRDVPKPITRLSQCKACQVDLHVCRLCKFYNSKMHDHCDHDLAEPAREIDVANFCGYFIPKANAFEDTEKSRSDSAMQALKALFGDDETSAKSADKKTDSGDSKSDYDSAREKFNSLFK